MTYSPRTAVCFEALDVAMAAKAGTLEAAKVEMVRARAEQQLDTDDPALFAITKFATDYELVPFDIEGQATLGRTLHDALDRALRPDPIDKGRADIHG